MSMVFCSSLMLEKSSNHSSSTRDLKIPLAFVMNKTPYSHFLLTVFTQCCKVGYFLKLGIILAELSFNLRCWNYFAQLKTSCNLLKICKEPSYTYSEVHKATNKGLEEQTADKVIYRLFYKQD